MFISSPHNPFLADIWSLGIIIYIFMSNDFPFFADSELELQIKISDKDVIYPSYFDSKLCDLLKSILKKDPAERISLEDLLILIENL